MPQLSPMLGFLMFMVVLFAYLILLCGLSKKTPFITTTKLSKSSKSSFSFFK
uniref:ATP synthase F0 subunit 8 n=1 Tax=Goniobranchus leopardus TaxID=262605 RepID=UPI002114EB46|nr:ATP synthase F0 subunit 8 [Goniobranchus leopardus]USQ67481.1 ATP synthase F0 subunit 8 [Goniobranchus leopardus]